MAVPADVSKATGKVAGVKRNFWPVIVCQLFCFSD